MNSTQGQQEANFSRDLLRDARATHDMATLRFEAIPPGQGDRAWALLEIIPEADSGSATVPGAMIESETGVLVDIASRVPLPPDKAVAVIVKRGSWRLLDGLGSAARPAAGHYYWTESMQARIRVVGPEQVYSPFVGGGSILCGFTPAAQGIDQFDRVCLVPQGWQRYVRPAWAFVAGNPALWDETPSDPEVMGGVKSAAASANPIVSILGLRRAFALGILKSRHLGAFPANREAEFVFLLLEYSDHDISWETVLAGSPQNLQAFARGALACALLGRNQEVSRSRARELLLTIGTRVRREDPAAIYVAGVLELLGLNGS